MASPLHMGHTRPPHTHTSQQSLGHRYFLRAQKRVALERPKQAGQDLSR